MTTNLPMSRVSRVAANSLAEQLANRDVTVIDVREPVEYASGHIEGSINIPMARLSQADLPAGPLVLVCQSGNRSGRALQMLEARRHPYPVTDLEGGVPSWQQAGLPLRSLQRAPLPLMRQVQIAAGSLVLLGLALNATVAPAWILLSWIVGAGLMVAGVSGFCGMARLLAAMPWNRVAQ